MVPGANADFSRGNGSFVVSSGSERKSYCSEGITIGCYENRHLPIACGRTTCRHVHRRHKHFPYAAGTSLRLTHDLL